MKITAGTVVTLSYDMCNAAGEIIDTSELSGGPVEFVHGKGAILPGLDAKLEGMEQGQEATFELPPEQAFGRPEDGPQKVVPRSEFPADAKLQPGTRFEAGIPGGQKIALEVLSVDADGVKVRMIHPLAGQKILITVRVLAVRHATEAERETGTVVKRPPPPPRS